MSKHALYGNGNIMHEKPFFDVASGKLIYDSIAFSLCFDRLQMNTYTWICWYIYYTIIYIL